MATVTKRDESYVEWIMEEGKKLILASHPDADDFRYLRREEFADGMLPSIIFNFDEVIDGGGKRRRAGTNYVYDRKGKLDYFRSGDEALNIIGANEPKPSLLAAILRSDHVTGIIGLLVLVWMLGLASLGRDIPSIVANAFTLVLGFYFGKQGQHPSAA